MRLMAPAFITAVLYEISRPPGKEMPAFSYPDIRPTTILPKNGFRMFE
jgi:hypothetical protein